MQRANLQSTFMKYKLYCTILPGLRKKVYSFLSKNFSKSVNRQLILPRKERRRQGDKLMMYERWCEKGGADGGGGGEEERGGGLAVVRIGSDEKTNTLGIIVPTDHNILKKLLSNKKMLHYTK